MEYGVLALHCIEALHDSPIACAVWKRFYWNRTPTFSNIDKILVLNKYLSVAFIESWGLNRSEAYPNKY